MYQVEVSPKAMFDTVRHKKAPQQIISQIRTTILEGRLKPGDKLPSEQELTTHFGVSRQTLREALRTLEYLGLLDIRTGAAGGAYVSEVDMATTRDNLADFLHFKNLSVTQISEVRRALEPWSARLAAERMTAEDLAGLAAVQETAREALAAGDADRLRPALVKFHRLVANATRNPILILLSDFIENLLEDVKKILAPDIGFSARVLEHHQLILEALSARDPDRAAREMLADVNMVEAALGRLAADGPISGSIPAAL